MTAPETSHCSRNFLDQGAPSRHAPLGLRQTRAAQSCGLRTPLTVIRTLPAHCVLVFSAPGGWSVSGGRADGKIFALLNGLIVESRIHCVGCPPARIFQFARSVLVT